MIKKARDKRERVFAIHLYMELFKYLSLNDSSPHTRYFIHLFSVLVRENIRLCICTEVIHLFPLFMTIFKMAKKKIRKDDVNSMECHFQRDSPLRTMENSPHIKNSGSAVY